MLMREKGRKSAERAADTKWPNDSARLPLFVDLNRANPFVIPQTVAAVREQIRGSPRRLVKSIPRADRPAGRAEILCSYPAGGNPGYTILESGYTVAPAREISRGVVVICPHCVTSVCVAST